MNKVNEYSTDVLVKSDYGYDVLPPAPPEGCKYVFDVTGNVLGLECEKESDTPIDVFVPPVKQSSFGDDGFPMWDNLSCDEILKNIDKIKTDLTMMRLTQEAMAVVNKQLAYAQQIYDSKCKQAPIDADILVGTGTGGIKTPVDTPVETGGGVPVFAGETPAPVVTPASTATKPLNIWWIAAAVVGIYLITRNK